MYLILWNTLIIPTPVETSWGPWKYTIHFMESSLILPLFSKGNTPPIPPWTSEWGQVLQFAILWHPNHMLCLDMSWLWNLHRAKHHLSLFIIHERPEQFRTLNWQPYCLIYLLQVPKYTNSTGVLIIFYLANFTTRNPVQNLSNCLRERCSSWNWHSSGTFNGWK